MDDDITIPRTSAEALIKMAHRVLEMTDGESLGMERSEVAAINNRREQLKGAVYCVEKAIYIKDSKPLNIDRMSNNAERNMSKNVIPLRCWAARRKNVMISLCIGRARTPPCLENDGATTIIAFKCVKTGN